MCVCVCVKAIENGGRKGEGGRGEREGERNGERKEERVGMYESDETVKIRSSTY